MPSLVQLAKACFGDDVRYRAFDDFLIVATTVFLPGYDESIALRLDPEGADAILVSDCHSVIDYWEVFGIDPTLRKEEIERIMKEYALSFDGRIFSSVYDGGDEIAFGEHIAGFIEALKRLAGSAF